MAFQTVKGLLGGLEKANKSSVSPEEITTSNIFKNLSREQQKDILINNPNIQTALGSQAFDPLTNTITLRESDFTKEQRLRQEGLAAQLSGSLSGELPSVDPAARFEEGRQLFQPEFQEQRDRLEQQLADQGLAPGSEAFNEQISRLEESQGSQLRRLSFESQASSEASRAARFNEISSLLGQQQVGGIGFGQFSPQSTGLDIFGAEQAGINRAFQNEQNIRASRDSRRNALVGAIGGAGGAGITAAFSDKTLKENIQEVGISESGIPIYEFDYINKAWGEGRFEGVMAQDLKETNPEAIITMDDGIMAVNYALIDVDFRRVS